MQLPPCRTAIATLQDCNCHRQDAADVKNGAEQLTKCTSCALQELNEKRVTLMEGSALSERDLNRAKAESSSAAFVLANRFSSNYKQEDLNVQFQVRTTERLVVLRPEAAV